MNLILVLEFIPNGSLKKMLVEGRFIRNYQFNKLIYSIVSGLDHMHLFGLIHRDLSPDNILVTADFECKIIDFSDSRFSDEQELSKYQGKPNYMSSEVKHGEMYGKEADIFSMILIIDNMVEFFKIIVDERLILIGNIFICIIEKYQKYTFSMIGVLLEPIIDVDPYENVFKGKYSEKLMLSKDLLWDIRSKMIVGFKTSNNEILLDFASEVDKILEHLFFPYYFSNDIMLIGAVAFDVELMYLQQPYFSWKTLYDFGRLLYNSNISVYGVGGTKSYKECYLDFDEQVGFRPTKDAFPEKFTFEEFPDCLRDVAILVLIYHNRNIIRIESCSNNPKIEKITSILDSKIDELGKIKNCLDTICVEDYGIYIPSLSGYVGIT